MHKLFSVGKHLVDTEHLASIQNGNRFDIYLQICWDLSIDEKLAW